MQRCHQESLLIFAQISFSPSLPGQAKYQLVCTRTHRQVYAHKIHAAQITRMNTKECTCSIGTFQHRSESAQTGPDFYSLILSDTLCYQLCPSAKSNLVHWISAALSGLAALKKYKNIKLHNCKISLVIPRSTRYLGT